MDPIVSIIVPVYNAEETLRRCIESVLNQGFTDFELLLVDDGSTDSSAGICREYENGDRRGPGDPQGEHGSIGYQESGAFRGPGNIRPVSGQRRLDHTGRTSLMVRAARDSGADMVIADFYRVIGDGWPIRGTIEKDGLLSLEEFAGFMMENPADFYYGVLWNKLFKREIIAQHGLSMIRP